MPARENPTSQTDTPIIAPCYCPPDAEPGAQFCGTCQVCGEPGHARHFPGSVPYTGEWCDAHYAELAQTRRLPIASIVVWLIVLTNLAVIFYRHVLR